MGSQCKINLDRIIDWHELHNEMDNSEDIETALMSPMFFYDGWQAVDVLIYFTFCFTILFGILCCIKATCKSKIIGKHKGSQTQNCVGKNYDINSTSVNKESN